MGLFNKKNVVKISAEDINDAKLSARDFEDENTRKRAFINIVAARVGIKTLLDKGIDASNFYSLYSCHNVLANLDIADITAEKCKIDVRMIFDEDAIFIPKSHFSMDILPDVYMILKPNENFSKVEFLGFVKPSDINKSLENDEFYFVQKEALTQPKALAEYLSTLGTQEATEPAEWELERAHELLLPFFDGEINEIDKRFIFKQLYNSLNLRKLFVEFENFEQISHKAIDHQELLKDSVLDIVGAQKVFELDKKDALDEVDVVETGATLEPDETPKEDYAEEYDVEIALQDEENADIELENFIKDAENTSDDFVETTELEEPIIEPVEDDAQASEVDAIEEAAEEQPIQIQQEDIIEDDASIVLTDEAKGLINDIENILDITPQEETTDPETPTPENIEEPDAESSADESFDFAFLEDLAEDTSEKETSAESQETTSTLNLVSDEENTVYQEPVEVLEGTEDKLEIVEPLNILPDEDYIEIVDDEKITEISEMETEKNIIQTDEGAEMISFDDLKIEEPQMEEVLDEEAESQPLLQEKPTTKVLMSEMPETHSGPDALDVDDGELEILDNDAEPIIESSLTSNEDDIEFIIPDEEPAAAPDLLKSLFEKEKLMENESQPEVSKPILKFDNKKKIIAASVAGAILITVVGTTLILGKNKPSEDLAQIPQIEREGMPPNELPLGEGEAQNLTILDVPKSDMAPGMEPTNEMGKAVSNAFLAEPLTPTITKIAWEVPEDLAYNEAIRNYLQIAGKNLKLSLQNDLLLATEMVYSPKIIIDLKISKTGTLQASNVLVSSSSKQIDNIVLQSVKETLKYVKLPSGEVKEPFFNASLIINF